MKMSRLLHPLNGEEKRREEKRKEKKRKEKKEKRCEKHVCDVNRENRLLRIADVK